MSPKKILIIDDDTQISEVLKKIIESRTPHQVTQIYSAPIAIDHLTKNHYDLLLMDYQMPNTTGYETFKTIQARKLHPNPPVIVSSTYNVDWLKTKFKGENIKAYFDKDQIFDPVGQKQFLAIINQ